MTRDFGSAQKAEDETEKALFVRRKDGNQLIRHVEADRVDDDHRPIEIADRAQA